MAHVVTGSVARQIGSLFEDGSVAGLSDRQLLERYINGGRDAAGEAAFAALVGRHGPMVLGVCRQLLGDVQHAEDAFQAVFLVLARRARSIRNPDLLGNWLYGVAIRTARGAREKIARRRRREEDDAMKDPSIGPFAPAADRPAIDREQAEAIHGEVDRLPLSFRVPVVLCYFEGLTLEEAARRLRCPAGTLHSRLARARDKLRLRLTRRGIALPAAVLTAILTPRSASASVPPLLCDSTTRAAIAFATRHAAVGGALSAPASALAQEVLHTMLWNKLKLTAFSLLLLAAVSTGAGFLTRSLAMKDEPAKTPVGQQSRPAAASDRPAPDPLPSPGRMFVTGRVLDPAGKPAASVPVDIIGRPRAPWVGARQYVDPRVLLGRGETDADGHFRIDAVRTSAESFFEVYAMTVAPGFGLGWVPVNADARQPAAEIRLRPEQVIRGKLVDMHGQPAAGVELQVWSVGRHNVPQAKGGFDGVNMGNPPPPEGLRVWPKPGATDGQGQFTLTGIGRDVTVGFRIRDRRFASEGFQVRTDDRDGPKTVTEALRPAMLIEGRILAADTGRPIPYAIVEIGPGMVILAGGRVVGGGGGARYLADEQGRFTANVQPATNYRLRAVPSEGQPYLGALVEFEWAKGAVRKEIDVKVPRGVMLHGKVVEKGTGRALPGASVQYIPMGNRGNGAMASGSDTTVISKEDGTYQITVRPGKGHLFVFGPTSDYILGAIGSHTIFNGQPGGSRHYAHGIIPYEVEAGDAPHEIAAVLRPGKTIKGRVVGPHDEAVAHAMIISTLHIEHFHLMWRGDLTLHARDGLFELHGLDPEKPTRLSFLDADHQWGATVEISARQAGEGLSVRLQPCGQARARFVGPDGKPVAKMLPQFEILGTPGPHERDRRKEAQSMLAADAALMANLDRIHYSIRHVTDAEGRITLPDLIPGALYRISDYSTVNDREKGIQVRKDFTVQPGEMLDLGDILIENLQFYGKK
jgi:RNA polymerase sigma factor (sigma-70 family)